MEYVCVAKGPAGKSEGCDRYCRGEHLAGLLGGAKEYLISLLVLSQCSGYASLRLVLYFVKLPSLKNVSGMAVYLKQH